MGPIPRLQHRPPAKTSKPVNHPFGLSGMIEKELGETLSRRLLLWLDKAAADGVAHQAGGFMNIEFLHQPAPMGLSRL
jgi:hypothetical protein